MGKFVPSDRQKFLALPIYMSKRTQDPEPRRGQTQFELFKDVVGKDYTAEVDTVLDVEQKITEFDFEKYLNPVLLQRVKLQDDALKFAVRTANFQSTTKFEQHQNDMKHFSAGMPLLSDLSADEQRALVHLLENRRAKANLGEEDVEDLYDNIFESQKLLEEKIAKVSEAENWNLKNVYRHN